MHRQHWRKVRACITEGSTKDVLDVLKERIRAKELDYVEKYDKVDPEDSINIAKCQEGRLICKEIISELSEETCDVILTKLNKDIKELGDRIKQTTTVNEAVGFTALADQRRK